MRIPFHTSGDRGRAVTSPAADPYGLAADLLTTAAGALRTRDARLLALAGAFIGEAVRPLRDAGLNATEAHEALRAADPALAAAVEAIASLTKRRWTAAEERADAVAAAEGLLRRASG